MKRTQSRPIPSGRISVKSASVITSLFLIAGLTLLYFSGKKTLLTALLALFIYDFLYTPLKKISGISVFVGAFVGALPPVSGYLSVKDKIDEITILLSLFMYIYQIPHTLSLFYVFGWDEWERAGFKTLSSLGREKTKKIITVTLLLSYIIGCVFIAKLILPAVLPFLIFSIFGMIRAVKNPREIFYSLNLFMLGVILTPIVKSILS